MPGYKGDEEDLRFLIRKLEISSMEDLQDHIDKYYPDDGPSESGRALLDKIIEEVAAARQTERGNRADDKRSETAMEDRKKEGYF